MSKAKNLGAGASFAQARPISARRAAIGAATAAPTAGVPDPTELPLDVISQNPDNPRDELRDLEGLADSIREIGLVNAITVATIEAYLSERPERADNLDEGARFVVVDGHRRFEASRLAGAQTIKVSVDKKLVARAGHQIQRLLGHVPVGIGRLKMPAQKVRVETLLLKVRCERTHEQDVVGQRVGERVEHQAVPLARNASVPTGPANRLVKMLAAGARH
ncbi:ParB/RepB/Spo0J family partition protein [Streptomyces sp. CA-252508]|uniref:ParB/RepB/Spo0J family partition protein n=1 Tax=Streptomyces sp. CA-252508 TaxID=3418946 RepID=UPI003D89F6B2